MTSLSFPVAPMKATLGSLPPDDTETSSDPTWAFEIKWDGHRTLAHIDDGTVRLQSTGGHDVSQRWSDVLGLADGVNASTAILDGEMLVIGPDGRPSFDLVQQRDRRHPAMFHVFDVLSVDGNDVIDAPYLDRRRLLDGLVEPGDHWAVPAHRIGGGAELLAATVDQELEGLIAKRVDSTYRPGARSSDWLKIKNRRRVEVTIGGFTTGTGARSSSFGALLVGLPSGSDQHDSDKSLTFAGGVGTGFTQRRLDDLTERLRAISSDACPFDPAPPRAVTRNATWVRPELRAAIEIAEFTNDGHVRHASFVDLAGSDAEGDRG